MKKSIFLFIFTLFILSNLHATHNRAGEILFKQLSAFNFEVSVYTYTKTSSIQADRDSLEVFFGDGSFEWVYRVNGPNNQGEIIGNDIKKNIYTTTHVYPNLGTYIVSMTDPNRNGGILNVNPPYSDQVPFHLETELQILSANLGTNQSPILMQPPIDLGCTSQPYKHNPIAFDLDGDSLAFELTTPLMGVGTVVSNYSFPNTIGGGSQTLILDPISGTLTWDSPQQAGEYNVAFFIKEYRNGVLISKVMRDMQITIETCNNRPPTINPLPPIIVQAHDTISFNVNVNDLDADNVTLTALGGPLINDGSFFQNATFTVTNNGTVSPSGTFSWVISCEHRQSSNHILVFRAEDDFMMNGQSTPSVDYIAVPVYILNDPQSPCAPLTSTRKIALPNNFKIYPNPTTSFLNVEFDLEKSSNVDFRMFNLLGQVVLTKSTTGQTIINEQLEVSHLPKGIYILSVVVDGKELTKKVLIE